MSKNTQWIGIALLAAAAGMMFWQSQEQAARMKVYKEEQAKILAAKADAEAKKEATAIPLTAPLTTPVATVQKSKTGTTGMTETSATSTSDASSASVIVKPAVRLEPETLYTLGNDLLTVTFTTRGGAVRSVAFKEYPAVQGKSEPYTLRAPDDLPYFALSLADVSEGVDLNNYRLVSQNADSIIFARTVATGMTLERRYTLTAPEKGKRDARGYTLNQTLSFHNVSGTDLQMRSYAMNIGTMSPEVTEEHTIFLNFAYYNSTEAKFIDQSYFHGGGFLFWNKPPQEKFQLATTATWAAVKSKFFALVTTPKAAAAGVYSKIHALSDEKNTQALTGSLQLKGPLVPAASTISEEFSSYLGPKEYTRLSSIGGHQDEIMQWGWPIFSFFSKLFISMLNWLAGAAHNYGVAIILLTLIIRAAMWPFTNAAVVASKKMAAVQPLLKEAQEKYKTNPEKLQRETVRIFQENKVNPLAGCLPALLQIPVFIGFFYMLRSAAELRFEPFLWIKDLSMPDTVAHISGFPINPLPVVMLVTMYFQIKLTPQTGDKEQQKIMQFTPFLFSFLLYNFSAGLTLYWTFSNLVSILQSIIVNRQETLPTDGGNNSKGGKLGEVIDIKATPVK